MPSPPNKYDDYSSYNTYDGKLLDVTPYRDALVNILGGIVEAYYQMLQPTYPNMPPNDEDLITARLYEDFLDDDNFREQCNLKDYTFELESAATKNYRQVGYKDLKVRVNNRLQGFESTKSAYVIECKRLDGKQAKKTHTKTLNRKYLEDGVKRFVDELYTDKNIHKQSAMLGYIISQIDISQNVSHINDLINSMADLQTIQLLKPFTILKSFQYAYSSKHKSVNANNIGIYHLMLDFSSKIEPTK